MFCILERQTIMEKKVYMENSRLFQVLLGVQRGRTEEFKTTGQPSLLSPKTPAAAGKYNSAQLSALPPPSYASYAAAQPAGIAVEFKGAGRCSAQPSGGFTWLEYYFSLFRIFVLYFLSFILNDSR